jgi:hypothetical protein
VFLQSNAEQLKKLEDSLRSARNANLDADSKAEAERLQAEISAVLHECQVRFVIEQTQPYNCFSATAVLVD